MKLTSGRFELQWRVLGTGTVASLQWLYALMVIDESRESTDIYLKAVESIIEGSPLQYIGGEEFDKMKPMVDRRNGDGSRIGKVRARRASKGRT